MVFLYNCTPADWTSDSKRQFQLKDLPINERATTRFLLFVLFYSSIQLYILLSPYLCFILFLYLDLYLLGDYTSIRYGSFMRRIFLIHIRNQGEIGNIKLV